MNTIHRRQMILSGAALALAGCTATGGLPKLPVDIKLPPELTEFLADASGILAKVDGIRGSLPAPVVALIDKAKPLIDGVAAAGSADSSVGKVLVNLIKDITPSLPRTGTFGTVVSAIETVLPVMLKVAGIVVPLFMAQRPTGMNVAQARMVLRS
jgi:hypothetical protein